MKLILAFCATAFGFYRHSPIVRSRSRPSLPDVAASCFPLKKKKKLHIIGSAGISSYKAGAFHSYFSAEYVDVYLQLSSTSINVSEELDLVFEVQVASSKCHRTDFRKAVFKCRCFFHFFLFLFLLRATELNTPFEAVCSCAPHSFFTLPLPASRVEQETLGLIVITWVLFLYFCVSFFLARKRRAAATQIRLVLICFGPRRTPARTGVTPAKKSGSSCNELLNV